MSKRLFSSLPKASATQEGVRRQGTPTPYPPPNFITYSGADSWQLDAQELDRRTARLQWDRWIREQGTQWLSHLESGGLGGPLDLWERIWAPVDYGGLHNVRGVYEQSLALRSLLYHATQQKGAPAKQVEAHGRSDALRFLTYSKHSAAILNLLGLDPVVGWRNNLREDMRKEQLGLLVRVILPALRGGFPALINRLPRDRERFIVMVLSALSQGGAVSDAMQFFQACRAVGLWGSTFGIGSLADDVTIATTRLVRALIAKRRILDAETVVNSVRPTSSGGWVLAKWLEAQSSVAEWQGDRDRVLELRDSMDTIKADLDAGQTVPYPNKVQAQIRDLPTWQASVDIAVCARSGDLSAARQAFEAALDFQPSGNDDIDAAAIRLLYLRMIQAHSDSNDIEAAHYLLDDYIERGFAVDALLFSSVLHGYARRTDADAVNVLWKRMLDLGVQPNAHCWGARMSLQSNRRDTEGVLGVLEEMHAVQARPTLDVWNMVMDAYSENGDASAVQKIYTFRDRETEPALKPDAATRNILLKALVRIGAPSAQVLATFSRLFPPDFSFRPTGHTLALILQSICDGGLLDQADELFEGIKSGRRSVKVTPTMYGIMIGAKVRAQRLQDAVGHFEDMRAQNMQPTAAICASMVGAYAALPQALDFAKDLKDKFEVDLTAAKQQLSKHFDSHLARGAHQRLLSTALVDGLVKHLQLDKALEVLQELTHHDPRADVVLYTMLLDGYRLARDYDSVLATWSSLFRQALAARDSLAESEPTTYRPNILCFPLSIVLDSISEAGLHSRVLEVWYAVHKEGFKLDAHNWNAFGRALLRSGRESQAWIVAEEVLCRRTAAIIGDPDWVHDSSRYRPSTSAEEARTRLFPRSAPGVEQAEVAARSRRPADPPTRARFRETNRRDRPEELAAFLPGSDHTPIEQIIGMFDEPRLRTEAQLEPSGPWAVDQLRRLWLERRQAVWQPHNRLLFMLVQSIYRKSDLVLLTAKDFATAIAAIEKILEDFNAAYPRTLSFIFSTLWYRYNHFPLEQPPADLRARFHWGADAWLRTYYLKAGKSPRLAATMDGSHRAQLKRMLTARRGIAEDQVEMSRHTIHPVDPQTWVAGVDYPHSSHRRRSFRRRTTAERRGLVTQPEQHVVDDEKQA